MLRILSNFLLFVLLSFALYPKPFEIFILLAIGIAMFYSLVTISNKLELLDRKRAYMRILLNTLIFLSLAYFLTVFAASWFEHELIFDIFTNRKGRTYLLVTLAAFAFVLLYDVIFFIRHRRWPQKEEHQFSYSSGDLTEKGKVILMWLVYALLVSMPMLMFVMIWLLIRGQ